MDKKELIGKVVSYRFGSGWKFKNFIVNKDFTLTYLGNGNDRLEESNLKIDNWQFSQAFANDEKDLVELNYIDSLNNSNYYYFNLGFDNSTALKAACKVFYKGFRK